jgi:hypothetical protein
VGEAGQGSNDASRWNDSEELMTRNEVYRAKGRVVTTAKAVA